MTDAVESNGDEAMQAMRTEIERVEARRKSSDRQRRSLASRTKEEAADRAVTGDDGNMTAVSALLDDAAP